MELFFRKLGKGKPIIILHGLYGSSDNWITIARKLSENYEIYLPDLRNHGKSPHHPEHTYDAMSNDLAEFITNQNILSPALIGHSMGGKVATTFVSKNPGVISSLVLVDISPFSYLNTPESTHHLHIHEKTINGLLSIDLTKCVTREQLTSELQNIFSEEAFVQFIQKSIKRTNNGFEWLINLDAIHKNLRHLLDGVSETNFLPVPLKTLLIKGGKSDYVSDESIKHIKRLFPLLETMTIANATHWLHAEYPALFIQKVTSFIN